MRGFFVAGSGTDVGKTVVTAAMLRALWRLGTPAQALKVVQTGVRDVQSPLGDTHVYATALEDMPQAKAVQPTQPLYCFALPASPHLAAAQEQTSLCVEHLCAALRRFQAESAPALLLLEGAGGLHVPINAQEDMLDVMAALGLPVLLVGSNVLGGLNHMLLSLDALRDAGLRLAGIALVTPADPSAGCPGVDVPTLLADNAAFLRQRLAQRGCDAALVTVPRMPCLDLAAWERLSSLLLPLAQALSTPCAEPRNKGELLLQRDAVAVWHPYASTVTPPALAPVARTQGNRIVLADGRELIDGMSSWWAAIHGYNHPQLMAALHGQAGRMPHVMFGGLTHEPAVALAERLLHCLPADMERVFFADSGSVAVEVAMKMALQYQIGLGERQRVRFLTPTGGYHGDTFGAMSVCDPVNGMHSLFKGILAQQVFMERPSCRFDRPFDPTSLDEARRKLQAHGQEIAAVILEPIVQGAGGMWFYHPDYLTGLAALCHEAGALLILDEIATGFGRTGKMFAMQWAKVKPDIVCCGKALTGGVLTLAATACTAEVAANVCAHGQVFMHGPTFMANPLACAVAKASLDLLGETDWQERVRSLERCLKHGLNPCATLPDVADVRVLGGIGVVETVQPVNTTALHRFFVEQGVWIRPFNRLIYLMPPYISSAEDVGHLCHAVRLALSAGIHC
ncbi:MAG: adenosylmethionine--8-amino-7-oxononanoate transaminase [Desulfovibrio sp.]|nr:adenosylmethionine--8-amino-7-oxononanoate transaminase [Desulfovibrio sp.]